MILAALFFFDWNLIKGPIARRIEHATGRTFAINGDLHVRLLPHPRIRAEGLVLGNAEWSRDPNMAEIEKVDLVVLFLPLLRGEFVFPEINLTGARILLEKNAQGVPNWQFKTTTKSSAHQPPPAVGGLDIDRTQVAYRDPTIKTDVIADISTIDQREADPGMMKVTVKGRYKDQSATLDGVVGSLRTLTTANNRYPLRLHASLGSTKVTLDGAVLDPLHLKGEDMSFALEGNDLAQLFPVIGVPLPPTPPYKLSGHLNHTDAAWTFRKLVGRVGHSDLAGDFSVDTNQKPQLITADLVSRNLDIADLGGFIGANRGGEPTPKPADRVLPQEPYNLEKLRAANAEVKFRGERIVTASLPLENLSATLTLKGGVLTLHPLSFGVAGGNLVSQVKMDSSKQAIKTNLDISLRQVQLQKLFPSVKLQKMNAGLLGGRANIDTTGNSIASMLAQSSGNAAVLMEGGSVSELVVRLSNLDIAHSLTILFTGDKQLPVRCMVGAFKGEKGIYAMETFVLDTDRAVVRGEGDINFATEALNLKLRSQPKDFSLAALRGPIDITGTFKNPTVRPELGSVAARGAVAVALGVVTAGVGALLPLLEPGKEKNTNCAALINSAARPAGASSAPGDSAHSRSR
ncbi:MAG: AsmA family protein [Betaproteobacteria bacterium]|nr:AsmA family protein [Betaproteobacteria bacterium]